MTFEEIHRDTECRCVTAATKENTADEFVMAIRDAAPSPEDFLTLWERGARGRDAACPEVCQRKALSMNRLGSGNLERVLEKYRTTLAIKPRGPRHYCILRCNAGAGVFWHTPTSRDESHHSFLKADGFQLTSIDVLRTQAL